MIIRLTKNELLRGALIGAERQIDNVLAGRQHRYGFKPTDPYNSHIQGAIGEVAVAKQFKLPYTGNIGDFNAPDAGPLQVRSTELPQGRLILHPTDKDHEVFILARTHGLPDVELAGWVFGHEGKDPKNWSDPGTGRPAFFVGKLRPIHELKVVNGLVKVA